MALIHDLCDALARDVITAMDELGDDRFHEKISKILMDMSPNTQEAYLSSIRALLAERKARAFLNAALKAKREGRTGPALHMDVGH
jgi:5'-deoxynucleotidase YfbR-like HD superfamily hydrolase